jgi:hypothetical protein
MHDVQRDGAWRASVYATLSDNFPEGGCLAHVARRLFRSGQSPFLAEFGEELAAQARGLAMSAPPHVLYPVIANVRLPRDVALVELPCGEAVYAEREGGSLCVCMLRTDGSSVTFQPAAGALHLPATRPKVDWEAVEAKAWRQDQDADMAWEAWGAENVTIVPLRGTTPPTKPERARVLHAYVLPSLAALALATSPIVDVGPTVWVRMQDPTMD